MFAPGATATEIKAAELQHEDAQQEQCQECAAGAIPDEDSADLLDAELAQQTEDADEPEDTQDLGLRERQAGEQVRPTELAEEVAGPQ